MYAVIIMILMGYARITDATVQATLSSPFNNETKESDRLFPNDPDGDSDKN